MNDKVCGCTSLMYASFYGHKALVSYLLEMKAEINAANLSGITALIWAVEQKHKEVVEELVNHGVNANVVDKKGFSGISQ